SFGSVGTLSTRHGLTFPTRPRSTIQTEPRSGRGMPGLLGVQGAEQLVRRLDQGVLGQIASAAPPNLRRISTTAWCLSVSDRASKESRSCRTGAVMGCLASRVLANAVSAPTSETELQEPEFSNGSLVSRECPAALFSAPLSPFWFDSVTSTTLAAQNDG